MFPLAKTSTTDLELPFNHTPLVIISGGMGHIYNVVMEAIKGT
jgi:hypothetical protein